jgi:K+-sensing histidine kinase KdpD
MLPALTSVAHELRTPLHGMLGLVALLRATALDAEQRGHVDALDEAARALLALADDALELARLDAGRVEPRAVPCAPVAVAEGVVRTLAPLAAARALSLAVAAAPDVPAHAVLDAGRVRQVLLNLVGNAVRVTVRGGVTVRVRADGDGAVAWDVSDTGPGLARRGWRAAGRSWADHRRRARDRSARAATEARGSGCGLSSALAAAIGRPLASTARPRVLHVHPRACRRCPRRRRACGSTRPRGRDTSPVADAARRRRPGLSAPR